MPAIDYSSISITAKLVAFFRQYSDIPFAQEVAESVHARDAFFEISKRLDKDRADGADAVDAVDGADSVDGADGAGILEKDDAARLKDSSSESQELPDEAKVYAPILEARYKSLVQLILNSGTTQVLELASGFSLRGLAMSRNSEFAYVDTDLPGIQEEKRKLVAALRAKEQLSDAGNYHIAVANALDFSQLQAATSGLRHSSGLVVINEGLLMYLSAEERSRLANNVNQLLKMFAGGCWITPDFSIRKVADDVSEKIKRFRRAISGTTDRQMYEAAFENEEAIDDFISEHGFRAEHHFQTDVVTNITSLENLKLNPKLIEYLKPRMRIWIMSPN
jgi:O-methyltransferase involved in polyketide biosynthesis